MVADIVLDFIFLELLLIGFLFRYIVSDCDAVATIHDNHKYVSKPEDAVAVALKAGMIVP